MDSGRLMISSAAPFGAAGCGQFLLFGGGGFGGGTPAAAAGTEDGRRKRPFQVMAHEELRRLQLELADDVDQLCGFEYELPGAPERAKRRLTAEQVRALELSFEEEKRKLEPERKSELARRLGISPRQVAVWFQNRRARWRAKQLEQDFDRLREAHDELLAGRDALLADNDRLRSQVTSLTKKLQAKVSPAPAPEPEQEQTAASAAAAMRAAVYVELIQEDQLCTGTTGGAVPAMMRSFAGGGASSNDSPESYFAGICGLLRFFFALSIPIATSEASCSLQTCTEVGSQAQVHIRWTNSSGYSSLQSPESRAHPLPSTALTCQRTYVLRYAIAAQAHVGNLSKMPTRQPQSAASDLTPSLPL